MNKILMTGLCFVVSKLMQKAGVCQTTMEDSAQLKLATVYLQVVKISRLLLFSILGSGACLMFLLMGLVLIHCAIFFYAPWDVSVKVTVTLISAVSYLFIAAGIFSYVFAEDKWMKMFNTQAMIKELTGK